jgi:chemotaxis signal transduction protein
MTSNRASVTGRAADLRRVFDQAFSEPPVRLAEESESLLALRAGPGVLAVRLSEITGLFTGRRIVRLPSPVPDFLGVAGLRHDAVPVYSLKSLLGYGAGGEVPRWLITARAAHPVAFAFEHFEGHLRVLPSDIQASDDATGHAHVPAGLNLPAGRRGVVSLKSLLATIEERIRRTATTKEP